MSSSTLDLLEKHHRDGPEFAKYMLMSGQKRFDASFWAAWKQWMIPALGSPAVIADFGCGPAALLKLLKAFHPQAKLIGVEFAPYMLEHIDPKMFQVIAHDLHLPNLPLEANSVDVIVSTHTLHELNQPVRLLESVHRCLKVGGRALLIDWVRVPLPTYLEIQNEQAVFEKDEPALEDVFVHFMEHNRYEREDIDWLLNKLGFKILESVTLEKPQFARWVVEKVA
ncbi:MAG: hypothetical protein RIS84_1014 [Pseudomonadota bacterium]|jgi:SAM-dependent methyltransferase